MRWEWESHDVSIEVMAKVVEPNNRILIEWPGYSGPTAVKWTFQSIPDGTQGAETVLSVDLEPRSHGCALTLNHRGFYNQERADHHGKSWEQILVGLDERLTNGR